jgi:hypothetical protein
MEKLIASAGRWRQGITAGYSGRRIAMTLGKEKADFGGFHN